MCSQRGQTVHSHSTVLLKRGAMISTNVQCPSELQSLLTTICSVLSPDLWKPKSFYLGLRTQMQANQQLTYKNAHNILKYRKQRWGSEVWFLLSGWNTGYWMMMKTSNFRQSQQVDKKDHLSLRLRTAWRI